MPKINKLKTRHRAKGKSKMSPMQIKKTKMEVKSTILSFHSRVWQCRVRLCVKCAKTVCHKYGKGHDKSYCERERKK